LHESHSDTGYQARRNMWKKCWKIRQNAPKIGKNGQKVDPTSRFFLPPLPTFYPRYRPSNPVTDFFRNWEFHCGVHVMGSWPQKW